MPKNKQEVIDAAMSIATGMGTDAHNSPVIDSEMTAEDLLPIAYRHVYHQILLENPRRLQDLLEEHPILLTNGVGVLPTSLLTEYLDRAFLPEFPYSSYSSFPDYDRQRFDNMLCYFTHENGQFFSTCLGIGPAGDGTIKLHAVTVPDLPNDATTDLNMTERDLNALVYALALMIRGELKPLS